MRNLPFSLKQREQLVIYFDFVLIKSWLQPLDISMKTLLRTLLILISLSCLSAWYKKAHFKVCIWKK